MKEPYTPKFRLRIHRAVGGTTAYVIEQSAKFLGLFKYWYEPELEHGYPSKVYHRREDAINRVNQLRSKYLVQVDSTRYEEV